MGGGEEKIYIHMHTKTGSILAKLWLFIPKYTFARYSASVLFLGHIMKQSKGPGCTDLDILSELLYPANPHIDRDEVHRKKPGDWSDVHLWCWTCDMLCLKRQRALLVRMSQHQLPLINSLLKLWYAWCFKGKWCCLDFHQQSWRLMELVSSKLLAGDSFHAVGLLKAVSHQLPTSLSW